MSQRNARGPSVTTAGIVKIFQTLRLPLTRLIGINQSIKDLETGGQTIGFSVGDLGKETTGEGYRDLTKTLRERKFLG